MRTFLLALITFCLIAGSGCGKSEVQKRADDAGVVLVSEEDQAMSKAIAKAQQTLPEFIARLAKPKEGEQYMIKAKFTGPTGSTEHMWVTDLKHEDGQFRGTLGNEPIDNPKLKAGSAVKVPHDKVSDWMVLTEKGHEGGFTVEVLKKQEG